jgi:type IV pilus assembly protein PilO
MALPAFFDPIVNLPKAQKLVLGAVGVAVIAVAGWMLVLSPVRDRITKIEGDLQGIEREIAQNQAILAQLEIARRQAEEIEQKLVLLTQKLPTAREMPPLYRSVSDAAFQTGLQVSLFQPREAKIHDFYSEIPIVVNAQGGYHDLAHFLDRLNDLPRVVAVGDWKLTGVEKSRLAVRAELTLATFTYRPVGSPPAPKPGAK